MPAPMEIYATGSADVYLAPQNTADPVITTAVPGSYIKVGVAGAQDYTEDGVKVAKATENNEIFGLGAYGVRKVFRTKEHLTVSFTLMDATLEAFAVAFNQAVVTTLTGPPNEKTVPLLENIGTPTFRALLIRAPISPYMDLGVFQWWIPVVYQTGSPETVFRKSDPVGLALTFTAIADATNGFGKIHAQLT